MKNNFDFEDYILIQDKKEKYSKFIFIIVLTLIGIIILLYKFEFQVYLKQTLIKDNDNYILIVNSNDLAFYENNQEIYINNKKYTYDIVQIDNNYSNSNNNIYQSLYIKPYNYNTKAIITECYFLKSNNTIFEKLIKFITGGLDEKIK